MLLLCIKRRFNAIVADRRLILGLTMLIAIVGFVPMTECYYAALSSPSQWLVAEAIASRDIEAVRRLATGAQMEAISPAGATPRDSCSIWG